jgi:hypothetical protein
VTLVITSVLVTSASAQTGGAANQIAVRSQDTNLGQIVVDQVIAAQDGWLVVYTDTSFSPLTVVGWAPVHAGVNTSLKVNLNAEVVDPYDTLWAVLHVDRGAIGVLELPTIDGPVQENGKPVRVAFGTQAASAAVTQPAPVSAPAAQIAPTAASAPAAQVAPTTASAPAWSPQILPAAGANSSVLNVWFLVILLGGAVAGAGMILARTRLATGPVDNQGEGVRSAHDSRTRRRRQ